ncbi:hypothetical protein Tco_1359460 [Tanacetum coccineum]
MYHQKNVDYVKLLWEDFIYQIDNKYYKKQEKMYYPRFTKVIIQYFLTQDKTLSWRNKIRMHTSKDDYLINTLRFISVKEETQIYDAIHPKSLTSPEMKETKAYKIYLEPIRKSKRVKRPAKKSIETPTRVALNEDAQFEEVRRKSLRDFHKTNLSGSGAVKIIPSVTSKGTDVKPGVPDVTEEESSESEAKSWGNDEDDNNNEQESIGEDNDQKNNNDDEKTQSDNENELEFEHETDENESGSESDQEEVKDELGKTMSNDSDDEDETKITDKAEGNEDEEMDYTTSQLYNDVDIRRNEPVDTDKEFVQEEGTDAVMTNKTEVPVTSSSHSSDLAAKFLNFLDIPHTDAEIVSPMDVYVHHEVPSQQTPALLTDPLYTQVIALVDDHLDTRLGATREEFMNFHSASLTARITKQVKNQLPQILPEKVSNFAPLAAATLTEFELKKILIDKMDKSESYLEAPEHRECYEGLIKSYDLDKTIFSTYGKVYSLKRSQKDKDKDEDPSAGSGQGLKKRKTSKDAEPTKEEPEFEVANSDMPQDQEENLGPAFRLLKGTRSNYVELEYDFEESYKALLEKLDWENPEGGIEDMVPNIWVPVKVAYNKHASWRISYWREQRKSFYGKHGYGNLKEIVVRRADNDLYRFKEGDFPRLCINDIEDILLLVVHNRLTNLSGDDVSDFSIALRMFTKSLVIQKRVKDLQIRVESYQKKINVTRTQTTIFNIRKRDPYTPYQEPQGLIYVDNNGRNRLMRSDELYKFSDRTLTRLRTSLDDITKII